MLLKDAANGAKIKMPTALVDAIMMAVAVDDPDAPFAVDRKGNPVLVEGSKMIERVALSEDVADHMKREVLPFAPGVIWDEGKSKVGYEVPLTRFFYKPAAMRSLHEIDAEVLDVMHLLEAKFKAVRQ
jgi:type I restriction enzyme M protein